ncbi:MAG TPA: hypothetical protein VEL72_02170, partial [Ktedonobacteraceae bacterium]|nr:hypothetical protein [Ktedonobacteraceae bacterium]
QQEDQVVMRKTRFWGTPGMIGENFFIRSFILPLSTSSSITKSVPEPTFLAKYTAGRDLHLRKLR